MCSNSVPLSVLSSSASLCYARKLLILFCKVNENISTLFRICHIRHDGDKERGKEIQIRKSKENNNKTPLH